MRRSRAIFAALTLLLTLSFLGTATQADAQSATPDINVLRQKGMAAFQQGDNAGAQVVFKQVIALDASDVVANNILGVSSTRLKDYPAAISYFKRALDLSPDEYHNLSGLNRAYTLAGMTAERDVLSKHIEELAAAGKLPDTFNYVFDRFPDADGYVLVAKFPKIQGVYGERYRFMRFNKADRLVLCVTLESGSMEQPGWAKQHPQEAAAGARQFSMDGYTTDAHMTFGFYDGEPSYEQFSGQVKQVLAGKKSPISKTTYGSPRPIPGDQ